MGIQSIKELSQFKEEEQKAIYKQVESKLFKEDKLYLFFHFIRGFFPGLAILAFLEAHYRTTVFKEHSLLLGIILGVVSIGVWIWVENYKSRRISDVLPGILDEMNLEPSEDKTTNE